MIFCVFGVVFVGSPGVLWWSGNRMGVQHWVIFRWNYDVDGNLIGTSVSLLILTFELQYHFKCI